MSGAIPYIAVTPAGAVDEVVLSAVADGVRKMFGMEARIVPVLPNISFALDAERRQYHSTAVLTQLAAAAPDDAFKVLAITDVDLFIPILTYVHGEAQLGGKACIISTFRLKEVRPDVPGHDAYLSRIVKEAVHELCHTFDLRHCKETDCIMRFCRDADEVDHRPQALCRYCEVLLGDAMRRAEIPWPLDEAMDSMG